MKRFFFQALVLQMNFTALCDHYKEVNALFYFDKLVIVESTFWNSIMTSSASCEKAVWDFDKYDLIVNFLEVQLVVCAYS